ncbi:MAG: enoyl-CoA hydratase/isomerase family protein [Marinosulfonomonas sp.]|nr:enoyl-CoA hydratase/isomerase family protein [Marinosulfonomonas sp.]
MSDLLRLEVDKGVGVLRFLQPNRRNPYSLDFARELAATLAAAGEDDTIRAMVMTGGEHFSSGGDLVGFRAEIAKGSRSTQKLLDTANSGARAAFNFAKPLISAVNGVCYGGGMSLALCADMVVAAKDARFCQVFIKIGGVPDTGSSWLLQQRLSAAAARKLAFTGREISGQEAYDMGLVEECVDASQTEDTAIALAREIAANPLFALMSAKRVMRETAESGFEQALEIEGRAQNIMMNAHDFPEAMDAFTEKRKPRFNDM